jgi:hypothetical protein
MKKTAWMMDKAFFILVIYNVKENQFLASGSYFSGGRGRICMALGRLMMEMLNKYGLGKTKDRPVSMNMI